MVGNNENKKNIKYKKPTKKNKKSNKLTDEEHNVEEKQLKSNITLLKNDGNNNIKYIVHLADIHIHKREREVEYIDVFDNLYVDLKHKRLNKENSLIVVAGDILHDKTDLHPISINLAKYFFITLCKISDVIVIPGNHDISLLNPDHNSVECIIKNLKTENNLYLLNDAGYYQINNILFGHTRFGQSKNVLKCDFSFDGYKCGLYHGIINGVSDNGYEYKNNVNEKKYFTTNDFSDYDFVFLGDIHKHSFLKKNIAYSGSLIQQTIDESLDKGYVLWNLEIGTGEFQKVQNDYGKIKIEIDEDGKSFYDITKLPSKLDVRIDCKSFNRSHIDEIYTALNKSNITINKKIDIMIGSKNKDTKIMIGGKEQNLSIIKNVNDLSNLLILKIKENNNLNDEQINDYKKVIDDLLRNYNFNDIDQKRNIKLISLEFNNMAIYGENNLIDFTKFKNIMGISGPNSSGKSSFIDIILYSLFEESTRGDRYDLINANKKAFKSKIIIELNNVKYTIIRTLSRNSKTTKEVQATTEFYENDTNISGKNKKETDIFIRDKIGLIDDLLISSIVTQKSLFQGRSIGFSELSSDKKRDILCKLSRLDIYDNLYNDTTSKLRSLKSESNRYTTQLKKYAEYGKDIVTIKLNVDKTKIQLNDKIKDVENNINKLNDKMEEYKKIKYQLSNYVSQISNDNDLDEKIIIKTISALSDEINSIKDKIKTLKDELLDIGDIKTIENDYIDKKNKSIQKYNVDIDKLTKQLWNDNSYNYKKFNEKNNKLEIKKLEDEKIKLESKLSSNNSELKEIDRILKKKIKIVDKKNQDEYSRLNDELEKLKNKRENYTEDLEEYQTRLDNIESHEYNPECKYCMKNSVTKEKISLENKIEELSSLLKEINIKIKKLSTDVNKKKKLVEAYNLYIEQNEERNKKENDKKLILKDNEICNEKIKNVEIKITELEKIKNNYSKYLDNENVEESIDELKNKITELQNDKCDEKIRYDEINEEIIILNEKVNKLNSKLIDQEKKYKEYLNNKELYDKNVLYNKNEEDIIVIQEDIDKLNVILDELKKDQLKINQHTIEIKLIETNINDCNKIYDQYLIINNILKDGGLIESIMKDNILPRFNEIVNELFLKFNSRPVEIKYEKDKKDTNNFVINIYDNKHNTVRNGGYQTCLNNLIFRIALAELNTNIKSNFMIIDEILDSADTNNKQELIKLINYIRSKYDWVLIVSHDDVVKDTFDNTIEINDDKTDPNTKSINY